MKVKRKNLSRGRVRYAIILDGDEAAIVEAGSSLEGLTPENWIGSSLTIRLQAAALALDALDLYASGSKKDLN